MTVYKLSPLPKKPNQTHQRRPEHLQIQKNRNSEYKEESAADPASTRYRNSQNQISTPSKPSSTTHTPFEPSSIPSQNLDYTIGSGNDLTAPISHLNEIDTEITSLKCQLSRLRGERKLARGRALLRIGHGDLFKDQNPVRFTTSHGTFDGILMNLESKQVREGSATVDIKKEQGIRNGAGDMMKRIGKTSGCKMTSFSPGYVMETDSNS